MKVIIETYCVHYIRNLCFYYTPNPFRPVSKTTFLIIDIYDSITFANRCNHHIGREGGSWVVAVILCLSTLILWVLISIRAMCPTLGDKVCQWPATGRWFSPGPPVSFINKTDSHESRYSWNIVESGVRHHKKCRTVFNWHWHQLCSTLFTVLLL